RTPSGLPLRQRPPAGQARTGQNRAVRSRAPQPDAAPPGQPGAVPAATPAAGYPPPSQRAPSPPEQPVRPRARGLEETRNLMSSYRSGTLRGRSDAARLAEGNNEGPYSETPSSEASEWQPPTRGSAGTENGG